MNFCKNCAHLLGKREQTEFATGWQCLAPANVLVVSADPVTGQTYRKLKYVNCATAREADTDCGPEGKLFDLYVRPDYSKDRLSTGGKASADSLLDELEKLT